MNPQYATDAKTAHQYLIDPLLGPDPVDETGPNSHFRSTFAPAPSSHSNSSYPSPPNSAKDSAFPQFHQPTGSSTNSNPFRRSSNASKDGSHVSSYPVKAGYTTPPSSGSPRRKTNPSRDDTFFTPPRSPTWQRATDGRPRRSSSLRERYPGDKSVHPLDELKREARIARRAPHLNKRSLPGADTIDRLDQVNGQYHHEGPYDATLLSRNMDPELSPVAAVAESNAEALKATPAENIRDALERHRPLENVAVVPPGMKDRFGRVYNYEEGEDMMIADGGNYKRWPGIDYLPGDIKGKGEPTYSIDEAIKLKKRDGESGIEMKTRPRNKSDVPHYNGPYPDPEGAGIVGEQRYRDWVNEQQEQELRRSNTTGRKMTEGLKRRLGSIRRKAT